MNRERRRIIQKTFYITALLIFTPILLLSFPLDLIPPVLTTILRPLSDNALTPPMMSHNDHNHAHGHHHHHHHDPSTAQAHAHSHATTSLHSTSSEDFTESNRAHWDKYAKSYTSEPWQIDMITRVTAFLQSNISWLGLPSTLAPHDPPIRVLDYACGPGTVTGALGGHADEYVGLDLSDGMVAAYNERFQGPEAGKQGFVAEAEQANLLSTLPTHDASRFATPHYNQFDLVAIGLGFHHFEDLPGATRTLAARVKPGGTFAIVDLLSHDTEGVETDIKKIVAHAGFGFEQVKELFEGSGGLVDVEWRVMDGEVLIRGKSPRRVFVARGRKPLEGEGGKL